MGDQLVTCEFQGAVETMTMRQLLAEMHWLRYRVLNEHLDLCFRSAAISRPTNLTRFDRRIGYLPRPLECLALLQCEPPPTCT